MAFLVFQLQQKMTVSSNYIHLKNKWKLAPAHLHSKKCFFFCPFYLEVTRRLLERQLPLGSDYNYLPLQLQYAISESARPFSFLNGVQGKWCKLNFELYGIHTKK